MYVTLERDPPLTTEILVLGTYTDVPPLLGGYPGAATDAEEAVMRPIDERTVLVTGATSGLGRQLVQRLAGAGATVIAHRRDAQRLHRTYEEILDATGRRPQRQLTAS